MYLHVYNPQKHPNNLINISTLQNLSTKNVTRSKMSKSSRLETPTPNNLLKEQDNNNLIYIKHTFALSLGTRGGLDYAHATNQREKIEYTYVFRRCGIISA